MSLILTPELEKRITDKVASGEYPSAADVVEQALDALRKKEEYTVKRAALLADIHEGLEDLKAGRFTTRSAKDIFDELLKRKSLS